MPTLLETASKLDKMLDVGWADRTPIAIENIHFDQVEGQSYLETKFIPYTSENVTISSASQKRERTEGVLFIRIRTPIDQGIGLAYEYAAVITNVMNNKNPLPNLFTYVTKVRRSGDGKDGWFSLICDVPFISDET